MVPLGRLVRVSRGIATGSNEFFVLTQNEARQRGLMPFARPAVTSAKELLLSPGIIRATCDLNVLIDLPGVLDADAPGAAAALAYIREGEEKKVDERCAHRKPWWSLGVGPAPGAIPMTDEDLAALIAYLNGARASFRGQGRTYHGGLEKFEPREMESLLVPALDRLRVTSEGARSSS